MYVYSNICELYITADTRKPLLKIVSIYEDQHIFGAIKTRTFSLLNYIPLLRPVFRTNEIDIRDDNGNPISFEHGMLTMTLHFKQIN